MITEYKNSEATYTVVFDDSKKGIRSETIYKDGYESEVTRLHHNFYPK